MNGELRLIENGQPGGIGFRGCSVIGHGSKGTGQTQRPGSRGQQVHRKSRKSCRGELAVRKDNGFLGLSCHPLGQQ